jgi:predicted transcriptional regulator
MKNFIRNMDPLEISNRFSTDQVIKFENIEYKCEDFLPYLNKLPPKERDLISLYHIQGKKQKEIAEIFSVTQGAISHRLSRAFKRLVFLKDMPKLDKDIKDILKDYFSEIEIDIIKYMIETTCQSKTAFIINEKYKLENDNKMTQIKVRHRFEKSIIKLKKLKKKNKDLEVCYKLLKYIRNNLYMLHEVVLPHFKKSSYLKINDFC